MALGVIFSLACVYAFTPSNTTKNENGVSTSITEITSNYEIQMSGVPSGKYQDGSYWCIVRGNEINVYIDNHYFQTWTILEEEEDGRFTFSTNDGKKYNGRWYTDDEGTIHLILSKRHLRKVE